MNHLVTIASYREPKTAYFLKETFEEKGIHCFFTFFHNTLKGTEEVRVQVDEEDVEKAVRIMMGIKEEYGKAIEEIEPARSAHRILVPTDFSEVSAHACHYAIHLAVKLKAEIKILHVYENPAADMRARETTSFVDYAQLAVQETERNARTGMVTFTNKIRDYMRSRDISGVKMHGSMVMGHVSERINVITGIYQPDVIVLGTAGEGEEQEGFISALAGSIIKSAEIPVYAVSGHFSQEDFEKLNILYATDFNENDHTSLNKLLGILEPFDKKITCVHIDTEHNPSKKERMDELNTYLESEYSQHDISCRLIEDEDVLHGIKEFAAFNQVNLLSFTTRKRSIFEKLFKPNLFRRVLHQANLPLLIFHS